MPPTSSSARSPSAASPVSGCVTGTTTAWTAQMNLPTAVSSLRGEGAALATLAQGAPLQPLTSVCLCLWDGGCCSVLRALQAVGRGGGGSACVCPTEISSP